jgi:hypothetical protein
MIKNFENFKLITESPDKIIYSGEVLHAESNDARAFLFTINSNNTVKDTYISELGIYHSEWIDNINVPQEQRAYPGRLWENHKLITFWAYPNEKLFIDIIKNIEKTLNIKMFNNNWKIEILKLKSGDIVKSNVDVEDKYFGDIDIDDDDLVLDIIPIEDYVGSMEFSEEEKLWHLMNAEEKQRAKKLGLSPNVKGWGSYKTSWDSNNPITLRYKKYHENNDN